MTRLPANWPAIAEEAQLEAAAIAVYDFVTGTDSHVDGDRWFHAASTIKVAILVVSAQPSSRPS